MHRRAGADERDAILQRGRSLTVLVDAEDAGVGGQRLELDVRHGHGHVGGVQDQTSRPPITLARACSEVCGEEPRLLDRGHLTIAQGARAGQGGWLLGRRRFEGPGPAGGAPQCHDDANAPGVGGLGKQTVRVNRFAAQRRTALGQGGRRGSTAVIIRREQMVRRAVAESGEYACLPLCSELIRKMSISSRKSVLVCGSGPCT